MALGCIINQPFCFLCCFKPMLQTARLLFGEIEVDIYHCVNFSKIFWLLRNKSEMNHFKSSHFWKATGNLIFLFLKLEHAIVKSSLADNI